MRRRDALRTFLLAPLALRPARLARSSVPADAVACYRTAVESLPKWSDDERARLNDVATARLDLVSARLVRRGRATLDAMAEGTRSETCDWLDYWTGARFGDVGWIFAGDVARLALLRARFAFASGRERRGLDDVADVLTFAGHFVKGRVFMAQLTGFSIEHGAIATVAAALPRLSERGLDALSYRLDRLRAIPPVAEAIRGERDFFLGYVRAEYAEIYDDERAAGTLPFYDRLIEAEMLGADAVRQVLAEAREGQGDEGVQFLNHYEAFCRARVYLEIRRALLRAAIAVRRGGPGALNDLADPTDGGPFALRSWASGFELTSRFALPDSPPAALLVGSR